MGCCPEPVDGGDHIMSIIIISSDYYQTGRELAQKTAEKLGYRLLGREILGRVAEKGKIYENRLAKALDKKTPFRGLSSKLRKRYLALIKAAVLGECLKDNVVCQGLAAHLYVLGISHVLRVRVLSDPEKHIQRLVEQGGISSGKAIKLMDRHKKMRRRWSKDLFDQDETDPSHYDLVINLSQIDQDEAVKIISETIAYRRFQPMTYSVNCLKDLELAGRVQAVLLERFPDVRVRTRSGTLVVETTALKREKQKRTKAIKRLTENIPGVDYVEVHVINDIFRQAAESFR
jgi:hypothetical protein